MGHFDRLQLVGRITYYLGWIALLAGGVAHLNLATNLEPLESVEDMAQLYLDALEELYPQDPYILIGYSFGGLVALEMAQRLLKKGGIALLVMLDTYPHPRFLPPSRRLRWFLRRMRSHAHQIRQRPYPRALSYFGTGIRRRLHFPGSSPESQRPETMGLSCAETALRRVHQKGYVAYANYKPRFYPGKVKFVTTQIKFFFLPTRLRSGVRWCRTLKSRQFPVII